MTGASISRNTMGVVRRDVTPGRVRHRFAAAALGVLAVVSVSAASCTSKPKDVTIGAASRSDVDEVVDASAAVTAKGVATLTAPADGTLAALEVQPGQSVTAGQELAVIRSPAAEGQLAQAERALAALDGGGGATGGSGTNLVAAQQRTDQAARTAYAQARGRAEAIADPAVKAALLAQLDLSQRSYQEAADSARQVIASVQRGLASVGQAMGALTAAQRVQARAAYDAAKTTVDSLTLRAPIGGVVQFGGSAAGAPAGQSLSQLLGAAAGSAGAGGAASTGGGAGPGAGASGTGPGVDSAVLPGARVGAGTAVLTVVDTSELGLLAQVDETDVLLVKPGVTASVELDAAPGDRYAATVRSIDVLPSASARGGVSYGVRLALGAGSTADGVDAPTPRPGMSAVAHLEVRSVHDAVTVPASAVFESDGRDAVWALRDGRAVRVPVTVGVSGQDRVQVVRGVTTSDRIVLHGADRVRAGQQLP